MHTTDILMVAHARPAYLQRALSTLVKHLDVRARLWIWQNGEDAEVRAIIDSFSQSGAIARYCQSRENAGLRRPPIFSRWAAWPIRMAALRAG